MKGSIGRIINDSGYEIIDRKKFDTVCECLEKFREMEDYFIFDSLIVHVNGNDEVELNIKYPSWVVFEQGNKNEFCKMLNMSDKVNMIPSDDCENILMKYTIANMVKRM